MTTRHYRALSFFVILLSICLALQPFQSMSFPSPQAVGDSLAVQRAMQSIIQISQAPRGMGTANHAATRLFLTVELRRLGMEVQSQEVAVEKAPIPLVNIIGRLAGKNSGQTAVLLVAHYDAAPANCPGAVDNASGVAVVLEIARAIAAGPQPANDLMILFTDGEELGVLGAPHFLRHPWAKSVKVALNFDSLSMGPVFLWQTSPQNGWLIQHYAQTPRPMAASWIDSIGRVLPLDTDFQPFLEAGITGAGFTSPYLPVTNHTPLDQPHLINLQTIQHGILQGEALTRDLLESSLAPPSAPDRGYFNPWGVWFVYFPAAGATGLGLLVGLSGLAAIGRLLVRRQVALKAVGSGALFSAANLMLVLLVQVAIELVIFLTQPLLAPWIRIPLSLALLSLLLGLGFRRLHRRTGALALLLGGQLVWAGLVIWNSLVNPLFSPLLTLILLASLLPFAALILRPAALRAAWLGALSVILLLGVPVVYLLYMITGMMFLPAGFGALAWSLLLALLLPGLALIGRADETLPQPVAVGGPADEPA